MIEGIIFGVLALIATEIIYFKYMSRNIKDFFPEKITSVFFGCVSAFFIYGFPAILTTGTVNGGEPFGNVIYFWYYGVFGSIGLFLGINYWITLKLGPKKKKKNIKR